MNNISATITVTDITKTPRSLQDILSKGSGGGYTVVPSAGSTVALSFIAGCSYLSVQASYKNGAAIVYKGDDNVKTDGSRQSKELSAGDTDVQQAYPYSVNLNEIFLTASANNAVINVEVHYA